MDLTNILVACIIATPSTIAAIRSFKNGKQLTKLHVDLNSRLTQLIETSNSAAHAAGVEQGRSERK